MGTLHAVLLVRAHNHGRFGADELILSAGHFVVASKITVYVTDINPGSP